MSKLHAALDDSQTPEGTSLCRFIAVRTTLELGDVDCVLCDRRLLAGERPFVRTTVERTSEDIARHRTPTVLRREFERPPWPSERHALLALVEAEDAGSPSRSISDPDRAMRVDGGKAFPDGDAAQRQVEHLAPAQRAREQAYAGPWPLPDGTELPAHVCDQILVMWVVGAPVARPVRSYKTSLIRGRVTAYADDIQRDLGRAGYAVGTEMIRRIATHGRMRMRWWMRERGLIPGAEMTETITPWDYEGWDAIAQALGRDPSTIRRWASRDDDPLPVHRLPTGRVVAYRSELEPWLRRQVRRAS